MRYVLLIDSWPAMEKKDLHDKVKCETDMNMIYFAFNSQYA